MSSQKKPPYFSSEMSESAFLTRGTEKKRGPPVNAMRTVLKQLEQKSKTDQQYILQSQQVINRSRGVSEQKEKEKEKPFLKGQSCMREIYELKKVQNVLAQKYLCYKYKAKKYKRRVQELQVQGGIQEEKVRRYQELKADQASTKEQAVMHEQECASLRQHSKGLMTRVEQLEHKLVEESNRHRAEFEAELQKEYLKVDKQVQEIEDKQVHLIRQLNHRTEELASSQALSQDLNARLDRQTEENQRLRREGSENLGYREKYQAARKEQEEKDMNHYENNLQMEQKLSQLQRELARQAPQCSVPQMSSPNQSLSSFRGTPRPQQHYQNQVLHHQLKTQGEEQCRKTHLDNVYNDLMGEIRQMKTEIDCIENNSRA